METGTEIRKAPAVEFRIDLRYEFSAPRFFDFCVGETEEEAAAAERWFKGAASHPASPLVGKVKSIKELSTGCSLEEYIEVQKLVARVTPELSKGMEVDITSDDVGNPAKRTAGETFKDMGLPLGVSCEATKEEPCTPKEQFSQHFAELKSIKASHTGQNIPSKWNHSELQKQATSKHIQTLAPSDIRLAAKRCLSGTQKTGLSEETHVTKKQKLEGEQSCQVLNTKTPQVVPTLTVSQQFRLNAEKRAYKRQKLEGGRSCQLVHTKTPRAAPTLTVPQEFHFHTEKRAHMHGQCSSEAQAQGSILPYISVAEMVQRFQMNILGELRPQDKSTLSRKRSLKLTHPKEPMLGTSLRARPPTVKSSAEQEEELLANLPRFKARPVNKRILQGPTLPPLPRSTPQLPEFQEFNLRTMERALVYQHAVPPMEKTVAMMSKFKARPIDKRIFSSRGDVGVFTVSKRQATVPKEFQFATDQRVQHHDAIMMEQQNPEQRMLQHPKMERDIFAKETNEQSANVFMSNPLPNTALLNDLHASSKNHGLQQRADLNGNSWQQMPTPSRIGLVYPDRNRKPLGEIQQQLVFGQQAVQQTKGHKKYPENNSYEQEGGPFSSSHVKGALYPPQVQQSGAFPGQIRPLKEFNQHTTPQQMGRMMERQPPKMSLPVYFMR